MNEIVDEWVDKAEADIRTAQREFAASDRPNYDAVCFHAQQCVEKLMKALLIARNLTPPRTHDLVALDGLVKSVEPLWDCALTDLRFLDRAAVIFRYPGESADRDEAAETLELVSGIRVKLTDLLKARE